MDNLAHTLVGAALAETGLKRTTALATPTLLIAANLPDIDALAGLVGEDFSLFFRRGWTHGVLAWAILPLVLVAIMLAWDRWVRRRRDPGAEPVDLPAIVGLSYLGLLTHPFLDWLNTYGVRLLMPFDGQWFYGDTLFIIDPWLWLLGVSSVILVHSRSKISIAGWTVLGSAASALVLGYGGVPVGVKIVWALAVGGIVLMRVRGWFAHKSNAVATVALVLAALYIAAMLSETAYTRAMATTAFEERGMSVQNVLSSPAPGNPFARDGVVEGRSEYRFFEINLLADTPLVEIKEPVPIEASNPAIEAALALPQVRGFRNWMRYPHFEARRLDDGWRVFLRDLRYAEIDDDEEGFGVRVIELDEDLEPR